MSQLGLKRLFRRRKNVRDGDSASAREETITLQRISVIDDTDHISVASVRTFASRVEAEANFVRALSNMRKCSPINSFESIPVPRSPSPLDIEVCVREIDELLQPRLAFIEKQRRPRIVHDFTNAWIRTIAPFGKVFTAEVFMKSPLRYGPFEIVMSGLLLLCEVIRPTEPCH
jgi:hypothetical protein